jgi:transposase-like protein
MQAFYYNYGGPGTMRNPRKSIEEQYALVIECRSSGLSNQQWCMQHDIKPGTFYNWVKRLRQKACYDIPAATDRDALTASVRQEVVKVDIVPDQAPDKQQVLQPSQLCKCQELFYTPSGSILLDNQQRPGQQLRLNWFR